MEGFGINTNVLETNVLNLAVVIGVLFVVGKDILTSNLDERRNKIVQSLEDVEMRYLNAQKQLEEANSEFRSAVEKSEEIKKQAAQTASQSLGVSMQRAETEIARLRGTKDSTISIEKQKLISEMRGLLTTDALKKACQTFKDDRSGAALQKKFIDNLLSDVFAPKQIKSVSD